MSNGITLHWSAGIRFLKIPLEREQFYILSPKTVLLTATQTQSRFSVNCTFFPYTDFVLASFYLSFTPLRN